MSTLAQGGLDLVSEFVGLEQLAGGTLACLDAGEQGVNVAQNLAEIVVHGRILHQLAQRSLTGVDSVHDFVDSGQGFVDAVQAVVNVVVQGALVVQQFAEGIVAGGDGVVQVGGKLLELILDIDKIFGDGSSTSSSPMLPLPT